MQVQGRVTRQPPGTLIQFRITAFLSPSRGKVRVLVFFLSRDSLQLGNFSCFLFSSLALCAPDFRKWSSSENWTPHRAHLQREGSLLCRVRFTRVALTDKWPAIIAGLSQQPRVRDRGRRGRRRSFLNYCSRRDKLFEDDAPGLRGGAFPIVADVTNDDAGISCRSLISSTTRKSPPRPLSILMPLSLVPLITAKN